MGVPPKLIPDLKALMGDPSDNYPGVSGIGPKTAVELIARYGSVEELYKSDALTEKLLKGKENAFLSKDLATIRTNAPVEVGELPSITTLDTPQVREKLEEFHFPSLVKRLTQGEKKLSRSKKTISQEPQNKKEEQLTLV